MAERGLARTLALGLALGPAALAASGSATPAFAASRQGDSLERLFLNELQRKLAGDPFFEHVRMHVVDDRAPLALLTQNPPNQRNRTFYVAWMHKLAENVVARSLQPLGLTRHSTYALTPVLVLADETWMQRYFDARGLDEGPGATSTYDPELRCVVTCETGNAAWLRRQPLLRDLALALLEAYAAPSAARATQAGDLWFRRGFAGYVAYHTGTGTEELDAYRPDRYAVEFLFDVLRKRARREALFLPLARLMDVRDLTELDPQPRGEDPAVREVFDDECGLWLHFLHHALDGKYRAGAGAYLGRVLAGEGGRDALAECLGTADLGALEQEFETYVFALFERIFVDPGRESDAAEGEAAAHVPIDLSALVRPPSGATETLGLALWRARSGRLDEAIALLAGSLAELAPAGRALVEFELARLCVLRNARDHLIATAIAGGERLRLQHAGGRVHAVPTAVAGGELHFASEDQPPLALDAIDSVSLALSLSDSVSADDAPGDLGSGWVRSYGFALGGDLRWKRFLRDRGEAGQRLAADAPERLPDLVAAGRALGALHDLGTTPTPTTPAEARTTLERIARARTEIGTQREQLDAHRDRIRALARRALELRFLEDGAQGALAGRFEALAEGRVRIRYDFSDESQLADFSALPDYLRWRVESLRRELPKGSLKVEKNTLRCSGLSCLSHRLEFAAPMSVTYEFEFEKRKATESDVAEVLVAICDDGAGSHLGAYAQGELHLDHRRLNTFDAIGRGEEPTSFSLGIPYHMELRHDGERASTWREGEKRQESPVLGLTSGRVLVWLALTGHLRIDNLVIEGTPLPRSLAQLRDTWVDAQLASLELGE